MLLKDVHMSTVFVLQFIPAQNSLQFSAHGISVAGSPWITSPRTKCTNYKCALKINNLIKLNSLAIILQLFLALNHQTDWHKGKSLASHAWGPVIDPHPAHINLHFLFCFVCFLWGGADFNPVFLVTVFKLRFLQKSVCAQEICRNEFLNIYSSFTRLLHWHRLQFVDTEVSSWLLHCVHNYFLLHHTLP